MFAVWPNKTMSQTRYWIGVAARDHVQVGVQGGFCQLCHGKSNPLKRMSPGDWIVYYSPRSAFKDGESVQSFTALGQILAGEPYLFDMGNNFVPHRRDVSFVEVQETPIRPLLEDLSFIKNKQSWGYVFRFGLLEIPENDFQAITAAMQVDISVAS
jgi:predicted RNA-binding protein